MKRPNSLPKIGLDLMGTERDPQAILSACCRAFLGRKEFSLIFVGDSSLRPHIPPISLFDFLDAGSVIELSDHPLHTLRRKKDASMAVGIKALRSGGLDAFISGGNTGALTSLGTLNLTRLPGILRPALTSLLPSKKSQAFALLDVGANLNCSTENLIQFASLGAAYQISRGIQKPRVGLLNVGAEKLKGTATLQQTYLSLTASSSLQFSFVGNIEAKEAFTGDIDVLITEGVTGNIFVKTAEGMFSLLQESEELSPLTHPISSFFQQGGVFLGFQELLIKCHSYAPSSSFVASIEQAYSILTSTHYSQYYKV